jgi:hypothetical protein
MEEKVFQVLFPIGSYNINKGLNNKGDQLIAFIV